MLQDFGSYEKKTSTGAPRILNTLGSSWAYRQKKKEEVHSCISPAGPVVFQKWQIMRLFFTHNSSPWGTPFYLCLSIAWFIGKSKAPLLQLHWFCLITGLIQVIFSSAALLSFPLVSRAWAGLALNGYWQGIRRFSFETPSDVRLIHIPCIWMHIHKRRKYRKWCCCGLEIQKQTRLLDSS